MDVKDLVIGKSYKITHNDYYDLKEYENIEFDLLATRWAHYDIDDRSWYEIDVMIEDRPVTLSVAEGSVRFEEVVNE